MGITATPPPPLPREPEARKAFAEALRRDNERQSARALYRSDGVSFGGLGLFLFGWLMGSSD